MVISCSNWPYNNIRYTVCLCLHMQRADREWLIRALCWTHARCSAEAVTYFTLSLSDNHTSASTKGQEGRGEACSLSRLEHMHSTGPSSIRLHSQPACLYKQTYKLSLLLKNRIFTSSGREMRRIFITTKMEMVRLSFENSNQYNT